MLNKLLKKEQGFTLIEVVLVLAIAGLILLIVFLAVGGAQRSRRDGQRKNDVGQMLAQVEQFASNNDGVYPVDQAAFNTALTGTYKLPNAKDPLSGAVYKYDGAQTPTSAVSAGVVYSVTGRTATVCISLEQGQQCASNK